jgi:hypothetical protein
MSNDRVGECWSEFEETVLAEAWERGDKISKIMLRHKRNEGGITARLEKLYGVCFDQMHGRNHTTTGFTPYKPELTMRQVEVSLTKAHMAIIELTRSNDGLKNRLECIEQAARHAARMLGTTPC